MFFLPPLPPTFEAALRDVHAKGSSFRLAAAKALASPEGGREQEAGAALTTLARDSAVEVRAAAVDAMGRLGRVALLDEALAALDDVAPPVREMAMASVAAIGGARAREAVREGLHDAHPEVRFQAVCAVGRAPLEGLEAEVARLLHDEDADIAAEAAFTLGALGARGFAGALAVCTEEAPSPVRDAAALALAQLEDPRAATWLRAMLRARRVHFDAILALGALRHKDAADDIHEAARGFFAPLLIKAAAGSALLQLEDPRGEALLRASLTALRPDARSFAVEQVGALAYAPLLPELLRLAERPRGVDPAALVEALRAFAPERADAASALARLAPLAHAP